MNFDLRSRTILFTLAGSRAYGIHTEGSDVDCKGVCIPPRPTVLGFAHPFEQADKPGHLTAFTDLLTDEERAVATATKLEGAVYGIQKFIGLAADCNPNILDVLFCRDEDVRLQTRLGRILRESRDLFLTKKARWTFAGYAMAQLKRIRTHRDWLLNPPGEKPERPDYGLPIDHKVVRPEQLNALLMLTPAEQRGLGLNDEGVDLLRRERSYADAKANWDSYTNWQANRNPARAALEAQYGYDVKHAGHLYRLLTMGVEILETGECHVWRGDRDANQIRAIRKGAWSYSELVDWAEAQEVRMDALYQTCTLRREPPREALNDLCVRLVEQGLWETGASMGNFEMESQA
jgi:predicted nucleotidyltransferase